MFFHQQHTKLMKKCYVSVLISVVKLSFNKICRIPVNLVPAAAVIQEVRTFYGIIRCKLWVGIVILVNQRAQLAK